jgi:hypothetical protein
MAGWDACTMEPSGLLRWFECHPALGGYVQLVGVMLAVIASALIAKWTLRPVYGEKTARAKVLIYRLLPPVTAIKSTTVRIRKAFEQTESGFLLAAAGQIEQAVWIFSVDAKLPLDSLSDLHVLDDKLAEAIAQLHYYLSQYNEFVRLNVPLMRALDGDAREKFTATFDTLLSAVEGLSAEGLELLQKARNV